LYESYSEYRSRGYSDKEWAELDSDETINAIVSYIGSLGHTLDVGGVDVRYDEMEQETLPVPYVLELN
jgi:hypothetical protein